MSQPAPADPPLSPPQQKKTPDYSLSELPLEAIADAQSRTLIVHPPTCRQILLTGRMCRKPAGSHYNPDRPLCEEHTQPRAPAARQAKHEARIASATRRAIAARAKAKMAAVVASETASPAPPPARAKETAYDALHRLHPQWFAPDAGDRPPA